MGKLKINLKKENNQYVNVRLKDRHGKKQTLSVHGYLIGMAAAFELKKTQKYHNLIIVTGGVGVGKSTLAQLEAALSAAFNNDTINFDNFSWSTEKFIEKTDRDDNVGTPQVWDEAIQGASGRNMAISNMGNKLKMAFVTKRFKKHTYFLLIDEVNEYAWKLIKMADAWINVRKFYLSRGYFDIYTNKRKIQFIYNGFKFFNKTWESKDIKNIHPDCKGKFDDYEDIFLDAVEYDKVKLAETQQLSEDKVNPHLKQRDLAAAKMREMGMSNVEIGKVMGLASSTVSEAISRASLPPKT